MNDLYIKSCCDERIGLAFDKCARVWLLFCRVVSCHHQNSKRSACYLLFRVCERHSSSLSSSDYLLAVSAQAAQDEWTAHPCRPGTIAPSRVMPRLTHYGLLASWRRV